MKKKLICIMAITIISICGLMAGITFAGHDNASERGREKGKGHTKHKHHVVPEPLSCLLFAAGGAALYGAYRVKKKRKLGSLKHSS